MDTNQVSPAWVVTGAAGFLGSHVVEQLLKRQIPVIGVDNLNGGRWQLLAPFAGNPLFKFSSNVTSSQSSPIKARERLSL